MRPEDLESGIRGFSECYGKFYVHFNNGSREEITEREFQLMHVAWLKGRDG